MERIKIVVNMDADHVCVQGENLTVKDLAVALFDLIAEDRVGHYSICCDAHTFEYEDVDLDEEENDEDTQE